MTNSNIDPKCSNCGTITYGPICHECGQKRITKRWTLGDIVIQFLNQLTNIESGFLYTIKVLFTSPGILVNDYWKGKTINYYNPFRYAIIWVAINLLINFWIGFDDLMQDTIQPSIVDENVSQDVIESADVQFDSWLNILVLLLIPTFSVITYWLFKKHGKNFAEHLIMNSFVVGQNSLLGTLSLLVFTLIPTLLPVFMVVNLLMGLTYNTYVFHKTFGETVGNTLWKTLIVNITGVVVFFLFVLAASNLLIFLTS